MPMNIIASALLNLAFLPVDVIWENSQIKHIVWPAAVWELPNWRFRDYVETAEALNIDYSFEVN